MKNFDAIEPIEDLNNVNAGKEWNKVAQTIKYKVIDTVEYEKASEQKNKLGKHIVETLNQMGILSYVEILKIIHIQYREILPKGLEIGKPSGIKINIENHDIVYVYDDEVVDICWIPSIVSQKKQILLTYEDYYKIQGLAQQGLEGHGVSHGQLGNRLEFDFEKVIKKAHTLKASDVFITYSEDYYEISFSINGAMIRQPEYTMSPEVGFEFIKKIKLDASVFTKGKFSADEHYQIQDARIEYPNIGMNGIDIRLSFIPNGRLTAMCATARILERKKLTTVDFKELGYDENAISAIIKASKKRNGLLIASGITGSGKSTLISYIVASVDKTKRIYTIEEPIEYQISGHNITQHQIYEPKDAEDKRLGFKEYMRGLKRSAPDVIYIGEVRNEEALIKSIIEMSDAGQLVVSTIHTTSAFSIYSSFEQTFNVPFRITVPLIKFSINQVLIDRLCDNCKIIDKDNENIKLLKEVSKELPYAYTRPLEAFFEKEKDYVLYRKGAGCSKCLKTGYDGRIPIYDYFTPSVSTIEWLMQNQNLPSKFKIEKYICEAQEGVNKLQIYIKALVDGKVDASEDILYNKLM